MLVWVNIVRLRKWASNQYSALTHFVITLLILRSGWRKASSTYRKRPPVNFSEQTGCTDDLSHLSPLQIFQLFFCEAVWKLMVTETNRYADQTLCADGAMSQSAWIQTDVPEMMALFCGFAFVHGHQQKASIQHALVHVRCPSKSRIFVIYVPQQIHCNPEIFPPSQQQS